MDGMPCLLFLIHSSWLWHFRCSLFNQIFVLPINFFTKPIKRCVQNRTGPFPLLLFCSLLLPWISAFASLSKVKKKRAVSIKYTTKSLPKMKSLTRTNSNRKKSFWQHSQFNHLRIDISNAWCYFAAAARVTVLIFVFGMRFDCQELYGSVYMIHDCVRVFTHT